VAKKFAKLLGMDRWLINPMMAQCGQVNLAESAGLDCIRGHAEALLAKVRRKYKEYGIAEKPFVVVKADNGTHGLGFMTVRDPKEVDAAARRTLERMRTNEDTRSVDEVIIQEGVPTYERIEDATAEPVVCMIDRYVVGGFYRTHATRAFDESLNAPGANYVQLAFAESTQLPRPGAKPGASAPNRFYMYGVIGRLAMLAAAYELEATDPDAESYE
jgi:glutamate--cysteine ligase